MGVLLASYFTHTPGNFAEGYQNRVEPKRLNSVCTWVLDRAP
jgi:hypothetical protein